jgi:hypothetical protein
VGTDRAIAADAETTAQEVSGTVAGREQGCAERHPVRAQDRYSLARPIDEIRIWLALNLLETVARLAEGGCWKRL